MAATTFQNSNFPSRAVPFQPAVVTTQDESSAFQRVGFAFLLVFLFLGFSRIFDVKFSGLRITGTTYRLVMVMAIVGGGFIKALKTKVGRSLLMFTVCFGMAVPFSVWKGGSTVIFRDNWLTYSFAAFLGTAGLIATYAQARKAINVLTWALFVFVIIANVYGETSTGRLFLEQGKFSNPNEMAQVILMGLPLWVAKMNISEGLFKKVFAAGAAVLMMLTAFRTGSRGAMIAFAVMMVIMFIRASAMGKMRMIVGGVLLLGFIVTFMPGRLVSRYKTVADDSDDDEMDAGMRESAQSSAASRKALLKTSIKFTLRHPLFGVGPGMFSVADNDDAIANGARKGQWLGTHNSYTQVSSELGIPAFIFYVSAVWFALKMPYTLYKNTRGDPRTEEISRLALGIHYGMIIFAVTILFEHIAYTQMLPVIGGLSAALVGTAEREVERLRSAPVPQELRAPVFRTYSPRETATA
jgi:hypothetical protein